jgi:MFS family permease
MLASAPTLAIFAAFEARVRRAGGSPLVDLRLFRRPAFVAGLLVNLSLLAGIAAFFLVYVLLAQVGLGFDALQTGLTSLPWPLGIAVAAAASVRLAPRVGRRLLTAGTAMMMLGMGVLILAIRVAGADLGSGHLVPGLLVSGLGMGMVMPTLTDFVLAGVPARDAGAASGVLNTVMQLGSASGVAVIGVVFFGLLGPEVWQASDAARREIFSAAAGATLWYEVGLFGLSCLLVRLLPERPVAHA